MRLVVARQARGRPGLPRVVAAAELRHRGVPARCLLPCVHGELDADRIRRESEIKEMDQVQVTLMERGSALTRAAQPLRTIAAEGEARVEAIGKLIAEWQPNARVVGVPSKPKDTDDDAAPDSAATEANSLWLSVSRSAMNALLRLRRAANRCHMVRRSNGAIPADRLRRIRMRQCWRLANSSSS